MKPHRARYWLNTSEKDPVVFKEQVQAVCDSYQEALVPHERGDYTVSVDEMTGSLIVCCTQAAQPIL